MAFIIELNKLILKTSKKKKKKKALAPQKRNYDKLEIVLKNRHCFGEKGP